MVTCFVSYSHNDSVRVKIIIKALGDAGYNCWFDESDIVGGQEWQRAISNGMKEAQVVVFFVSPDSLASEWCAREQFLALHENKPIIPVLITKTTLPADLAQIQYIDLRDDNSNILSLVRAINLALEGTSKPIKDAQGTGKTVITTFNKNVNVKGDLNIG